MTEYAQARAAARQPAAPSPAKPSRVTRQPLRRVSKKRAALMSRIGPERRDLKILVGQCMKCRELLTPDYLDIHEIASGDAREKCLRAPDLQIVLCRECHMIVQYMPPAKQIAVRTRWIIDGACALYCELKGYAPTAVMADEVVDYLMFKPKGRKRGKK